jgi:hypothetical protein
LPSRDSAFSNFSSIRIYTHHRRVPSVSHWSRDSAVGRKKRQPLARLVV